MRVAHITLSNRSGREEKFELADAFVIHDALRHIAWGETYTRAAFGGRTKFGKSGIALELYDAKVTGHKIDPIPSELVDRVEHYSLDMVREAFLALQDYRDVLIGDEKNGLLLRWNGHLEIFGAGKDSIAPP